MLKAKSRLRLKRDNDTPEKMSDDSRSNLDTDSLQKVNESFEELKITEEILQKFYNTSYTDDQINNNNNTSTFAVRYELPLDKQKPPTKRICVLKKAPDNTPAVPSSALLESISLRMDSDKRPVQHSILGSLEDFFKMSLKKETLKLQEIPPEFHYLGGQKTIRRSITSFLPASRDLKPKNDLGSSRKIKTSRELIDTDSKALKLWEQRMMERRTLQTHISKRVQRLPESLIFNSGEEYRKKFEVNHMISKSIPFYGGGYGYRSGSEFWKQNEIVGIYDNCNLHMSNTQTEKGYPASIVHVGVSNFIKQEKGVPVNIPKIHKHNEYESKRVDELKDVIHELDPYQPEIDELVIKGYQLKNNNLPVELNPDPIDTSEALNDSLQNDSYRSHDLSRPNTDQSNGIIFPLSRGPCLLINYIDVNSLTNGIEDNPLEIRVLFNDFTHSKCLMKIYFHNKGSSIIRLWWKKLEFYDPFQLDNKNTRRFYFNTKDEILLPNQELNFPVIFKSEKSGIFTERWRLETLPTLANGRDIIIHLKGVALQRDTLANTRKNIEYYLNYQVAENIAHGILDDIVESLFYKIRHHSTDEGSIYLEKEIFSSKNERIIYEIENVSSLKKLHEQLELKEVNMSKEWSLSCLQLRNDIYNAESLKNVKKEETCAKFYKHIDKMMFASIKSDINKKDLLYRIGYRSLLDLGGNMFTILADLRTNHGIPQMELRISHEKKGSNLSRQKTNNSQSSKTSNKKPNESRASISSMKVRSKEPSNLVREYTDALLTEVDETEKMVSRSASDVDDLQTDNEVSTINQSNPNIIKYNKKSLQMVYALLDQAIDNIINFWDDISST